ncbi:MAG: chemotaxis protein CheW [Leptolyngbyaceae bacterium]|nr:chemotaxis protein CheW [Leptolyngbyaceae bacterium]
METKSYLIFTLHDLLYGIDTLAVQEIFSLPELTPIAEAPYEIIGGLNLRGKLLPVMDLDLRLGQQPQPYTLNHSVIVLELHGIKVGIIVNEVQEVLSIDPIAIEGKIAYGKLEAAQAQFTEGVAKVESKLIVLLNPEHLLFQPTLAPATTPRSASEVPEPLLVPQALVAQGLETSTNFERLRRLSSFYALACPDATSEEREIFRARANNLMQPTENSDFSGLMPLAVVGLNGEYFGLGLEVVREFTSVRTVTPIPCCPSHIIGNMNLRGEIVTLVDVRKALNLPLKPTEKGAKAMVIHIDDLVAAVLVDDVFDVTYLHASEITAVPTAVQSGSEEYLQGTAHFGEKMLGILDLPKILMQGGLMVDEII